MSADIAKPKTYKDFLSSKCPRFAGDGIEPKPVNKALFDFQQIAVDFCLRKGRAGLYLDTGLGKTICELEYASQALEATNGRALILTPLAVAKQIEREAAKFGYDARVIRNQAEVKPGISICNYERLDKLDTKQFSCVVLDESSLLKNMMGSTSQALRAAFPHARFKLCASATPAPNDHMELGTQSEFLGHASWAEMLAKWFINDASTASKEWRLKGHAVNDFWNWLASWAVMVSDPADLGFTSVDFQLPNLKIVNHDIITDMLPRTNGGFLSLPDYSATNIHGIKRHTSENRAKKAAELVNAEPNEPWLLWVDTDYEATDIKRLLPKVIEVSGSMPIEQKEGNILRFLDEPNSILLTKPKIAGMGLNLQHCARMIFVGRTFSYEQFYQAVRRCWRFGQKREVIAHLLIAEGEDQIRDVINRKTSSHDRMKSAMQEATKAALGLDFKRMALYDPSCEGRLPTWLR